VLKDNLSKDFHDYGMWWTPDAIIIEIDGEPVATIVTHGSVTGELETRFSTALAAFAGKVPENPAGHDMVVSWFKFFAL
jgi:beta-glucanase (GH16 family)